MTSLTLLSATASAMLGPVTLEPLDVPPAVPLAGRLLVAAPVLTDPHFARTVVLLLDHDEDGTVGLVLNRPSHVPVGAVLPVWDGRTTGMDVLFTGGPVSEDSALALGLLPGQADAQSARVCKAFTATSEVMWYVSEEQPAVEGYPTGAESIDLGELSGLFTHGGHLSGRLVWVGLRSRPWRIRDATCFRTPAARGRAVRPARGLRRRPPGTRPVRRLPTLRGAG